MQGSHLRDLNRAGQHAMVVQEFESGAVQVLKRGCTLQLLDLHPHLVPEQDVPMPCDHIRCS
jgi:hypothetical protein